MPAPTVARAEQLAAQLLGAGIRATHDVAQLSGMAPAVLVPPPRLTFDSYSGRPSATWRLLAVASTPQQLDAWLQLDELVTAVAELLPVELAEPVSFATDPAADALPAYALTITD